MVESGGSGQPRPDSEEPAERHATPAPPPAAHQEPPAEALDPSTDKRHGPSAGTPDEPPTPAKAGTPDESKPQHERAAGAPDPADRTPDPADRTPDPADLHPD
ncbi:peptidase, partial [Streptomyces sp. ID05-39B]|nr:peptidase [Streptomyces sp. ID05-39B]